MIKLTALPIIILCLTGCDWIDRVSSPEKKTAGQIHQEHLMLNAAHLAVVTTEPYTAPEIPVTPATAAPTAIPKPVIVATPLILPKPICVPVFRVSYCDDEGNSHDY